ncbi:MAG: helix-turn-helix domain-containing protein [Pseudonocardiaceae bacterium]
MSNSKRRQPTDVGHKLRKLRHDQGKTLEVVSGLAGISASHLSRLETGDATLDRLSLIVALARTLQTHPAELIRLGLRALDHSSFAGTILRPSTDTPAAN